MFCARYDFSILVNLIQRQAEIAAEFEGVVSVVCYSACECTGAGEYKSYNSRTLRKGEYRLPLLYARSLLQWELWQGKREAAACRLSALHSSATGFHRHPKSVTKEGSSLSQDEPLYKPSLSNVRLAKGHSRRNNSRAKTKCVRNLCQYIIYIEEGRNSSRELLWRIEESQRGKQWIEWMQSNLMASFHDSLRGSN